MTATTRRIFIFRADEMEDGPFELVEAAKLMRAGRYEASNDARFENERTWSKLGELLIANLPREFVQPPLAGTAAGGAVHPAIESLLNLPFSRILPFVLKVYLALILVGATVAAVATIIVAILVSIFGITILSGLPRFRP